MKRGKNHRQVLITEEVNRTGKVWVADLAKEYGVTPETIRRDLDELELNGMVSRVHGAAVPYQSAQAEMVFEAKNREFCSEKKKIAEMAAHYIKDGQTIVVGSGTTTLHIADYVYDVHGLTVITNSLAAAIRFNLAVEEGRMTGKIFMLPGMTNPYQSMVKGTYTIDFLKKFHFDIAFISCGGFSETAVYDFDIEEALVSTIMIKCSNQAVLLADHSKINKKTLFQIEELSKLDVIISDQARPHSWSSYQGKWQAPYNNQ